MTWNTNNRIFHSINGVQEKLYFLGRKYWSIVKQQQTLHIMCHIIKSPYPQTSQSFIIEPDFVVHMFCVDVEINAIGEYQIPDYVSDTNTFEIIIGNMKDNGHRRISNQASNCDFFITFRNVLSAISAR